MKTSLPLSVVLSVLLVMASGCGRPAVHRGPEPAPTLTELKNATYRGLAEQDPVTLSDGRWEGAPFVAGAASRPRVSFVRDFFLNGDFDGDGAEESAVLLAAGSAGTGENIYLAVMGRGAGGLENLDTVLVGDRVQLRQATFQDGTIFLDLVRAGDQDAMCCPGELARLGWRLKDGRLKGPEAAGETGRLSLETVAGTEWVLRWWNLTEEAPAEPEITLLFEDGRMGGKSGCNTYFAAPHSGDQPGDLGLGPIGATLMACPEAVLAVEQRVLAQLEGANRFGFLAGMLALSYRTDAGSGAMLFEGRTPQ